jgi:hypothetical protein
MVKLKKSILVDYYVRDAELFTGLLDLGIIKCEDFFDDSGNRPVLVIFRSGQFCFTNMSDEEKTEERYIITMGTPSSIVELAKDNIL